MPAHKRKRTAVRFALSIHVYGLVKIGKEGRLGKYYLVNDETVRATGNGSYRVRVWRKPGHALVLSEPEEGSPPPDLHSTSIANLVSRTMLGYSAPRTSWYEHSVFEGRHRAFRVTYDQIGNSLRPILIDPAYTPVKWAALWRSIEDSTSHEEEEASESSAGFW